MNRLGTWTTSKKKMKLYTLFPLLSLLSFTFIQAESILAYKFRTHEAKKLYDEQKGYNCVHRAIEVQKCGTDHLLIDTPVNRAAYEACVKALKFPTEFETEALSLQAADFSNPTAFELAYSRKLLNYVKKIDKMFEGPAKPDTIEFSMNWLALLLLPLAFGIVYFINKPKASSAATTVDQVEDATDNESQVGSETAWNNKWRKCLHLKIKKIKGKMYTLSSCGLTPLLIRKYFS